MWHSPALVQGQRKTINKDTLELEAGMAVDPAKQGGQFSETKKHNTKWAAPHSGKSWNFQGFAPNPNPNPRSSGLQAISSVFLFLCSVWNHILKRHFLKGKDWEKNTDALRAPV